MSKRPTDVVETSTGELRICCPFCEDKLVAKSKDERVDTGYHLYINPKKGFYFCHRCDSKGKAEHLKYYISDINSYTDHWDTIEKIQKNYGIQKAEREYFNLDLVGNAIVEGTPSWNYLTRERGLSPDEIRYYDIRSGIEEMRRRVVVPVFDPEGYCIYYSGRLYSKDYSGPKYKNPKVDKKTVVFNLHRVPTDHVIVCEGMFSAIHAGKSAVAVLGKYISSWQYHAIARRYKKVYVALDGDVYHKDLSLPPKKKVIPRVVETFQGLGCSVGVVALPNNQDPEDYGREKFQTLLEKIPLKKKSDDEFKPKTQRRFYS